MYFSSEYILILQPLSIILTTLTTFLFKTTNILNNVLYFFLLIFIIYDYDSLTLEKKDFSKIKRIKSFVPHYYYSFNNL